MIKYLFILINSISLFFVSFFGDGGITVTGNIPSTLTAGQETAIELTVNKGESAGFARLQLDLPEGTTIKSVQEKGATYSFEKGVAEWVWAVLPSDNEIIIKLSIIPSESNIGTKSITAKYSYVENNEKQVVEMTPVEVLIVSSAAMANNSSDSLSTKKDSVKTSQLASNSEPPGNIAVTRKIEAGSVPSEYIITVNIDKGMTRGFARYSDDLPEGVTVKSARTDGASFSVADGKLKFVWVNVPDKEMLDISYVLNAVPTQSVVLKGEYSYLENNQSKKIRLNNETINKPAGETPLATENPKKEDEKEPVMTVPVVAKKDEEKNKAVVVKTKKSPTTGNTSTAVTGINEENTVYLVQVGAFSKKRVTSMKLKDKFKFTETIRSEMQGGFTKFMVGSHPEYKGARDHRESIISNNGIKSAFVVAYNHGKRITVQEALMITNQKWFK